MTILLALTLLTVPTVDSWRYADAVSILGNYTPSSIGVPAARRLDTPPPADNRPAGGTDFSLTYGSCREMQWYRQHVGLPERFDHLGWREGRCTNLGISLTGCCVGYWQIHRVHDGLIRRACGVFWSFIRGDSPDAKMANACAAKALFDEAGYQPWAA